MHEFSLARALQPAFLLCRSKARGWTAAAIGWSFTGRACLYVSLTGLVATWAEPVEARDTVKKGSREEAVEVFAASEMPAAVARLRPGAVLPTTGEARGAYGGIGGEVGEGAGFFSSPDLVRRAPSILSYVYPGAARRISEKGSCEGDTGTRAESDGQRLDECCLLTREVGGFVKAARIHWGPYKRLQC